MNVLSMILILSLCLMPSHGTDLWDKAAVSGLNWESSVWRMDAMVWPVERSTGHFRAVTL